MESKTTHWQVTIGITDKDLIHVDKVLSPMFLHRSDAIKWTEETQANIRAGDNFPGIGSFRRV